MTEQVTPSASALVIVTTTRLMRHARSKCGSCGLRRVLYSLTAASTPAVLGESESARLCAHCAGIGHGRSA